MNESFPRQHGLTPSAEYLDIQTPWIDIIRDEGCIFPYTYTSAPKCSPSRYSLLTGRYASRSQAAIAWVNDPTTFRDPENGTLVNVVYSRLDGIDSIYNLPQVLKNYSIYNYTTGMVGKFHLLTNDDEAEYCDSIDNDNLYNHEIEQAYYNCVERAKQVSGFDYVGALYYTNIASNSNRYSRNPEWITDRAMNFTYNASVINNKPFFLYVAHTTAHTPEFEYTNTNFGLQDTPKGELTGDDIPDDTGMLSRNAIWYKVGPGMGMTLIVYLNLGCENLCFYSALFYFGSERESSRPLFKTAMPNIGENISHAFAKVFFCQNFSSKS